MIHHFINKKHLKILWALPYSCPRCLLKSATVTSFSQLHLSRNSGSGWSPDREWRAALPPRFKGNISSHMKFINCAMFPENKTGKCFYHFPPSGNSSQKYYLQINAPKTQAMTVGPVPYRCIYSLDNHEVDANDTLKILGVTLDRKLNFVAHVSEQVKKACAKASALWRIRRFITLDVMCRLFKAYILPHLGYCCPLLLGVGRDQVKN